MPVSTTSSATCPDACPFKAGGCYAKAGPLGMMWSAMSKAKPGSHYDLPRATKGYAYDWQGFTHAIASLPMGTMWRHNQAGDLPGNGDLIDGEALAALVEANKGKRGFTYTHKPLTTDNAKAIARANAGGFTVNLSANTLREADELAAANVGPVVTVLPAELERRHTKSGEWTEGLEDYRRRVFRIYTPQNRRVVVCPATFRDDVSCSTCGLCQKQNRKVIVGFPAHGAAKRKASAIASA